MEKVFVLIVVLVAVLPMSVLFILEQRRYKKRVDEVLPSIPYDRIPPMPKCKPPKSDDSRGPKRIYGVYDRYAFVAIDDIKAGDLLEVVPAYKPGDIFCYGDDDLCGNYWGASFGDHIDGSGYEGMVYKDGLRNNLGKFETKMIAIETAIKVIGDSVSDQDANTLTQLNLWLAEEKEKAENKKDLKHEEHEVHEES